ncbi:hypothetical protein [Emticicia sp. TH156]|uniref:hypothetical protein n=1 Tax=Emticicia sp. TH156 TaxID=2067454 RepID=UPI000C75C0FD|nr:hypothetical protein [Emticicia sp. TH156]PLK42983.1 hypothetical protein C0V77_18925 [Emticicia sp. TH156]
MDLRIIPECYIDTKLINSLVPPTTKYNHQKGCPAVVNIMQNKFRNDFAVGIIDRDKIQLSYSKNFDVIFDIPNSLQLCKFSHHYLIFICPAMERWIISNLEMIGLKLKDFGLPENLSDFTKITKSTTSDKSDKYSQNFRELFKELKRQNPPSVAALSFWITYLKDNPYNADVEHIYAETSRILNNPFK